jgi:hypothetical protein
VIGGRARRAGSVFERSLHRAATLAVGVILIGAVSVPTASAGLVEGAADIVGSTVKSVQASANGAPSLPSTTLPVKPPGPPLKSPPAATPAPPPQAPVKLPSQGSSPSSSRAGTGSAEPPSVGGIAGAAQGAVDSVTRVGNEAASGATTSEHGAEAPATAPLHRVDRGASEAIVRERRKASSPLVAVRAAEVAALQRWLARVWPAISLGGSGVIGPGVVGVIAGGLFRPALAAVTGVLVASSPILPTSGDAPLAEHHGVAGASRSAPNPAPTPAAAEGGSVFYLIVMAGLLALLAFTVWREFQISLHPGSR